MNILITGAGGFVGMATLAEALRQGHKIICTHSSKEAAEAAKSFTPNSVQHITIDINGTTDWGNFLNGVDVVIHLAARTHVLKETSEDPLHAFRQVNAGGTRRLAKYAVNAGVSRFILLSSIHVNGVESTKPFTESDKPNPTTPYAVSKLESEEALLDISFNSSMQPIIIRPPLLYGPGVKANFYALLKMASMPLPFAWIQNHRSLLGVRNAANFLLHCANYNNIPSTLYLLSDGEDISTPNLIKTISKNLGKKSRLFGFPIIFLKIASHILNRPSTYFSLVCNLQVDSQKARSELNWEPIMSLEEGLSETCQWFKNVRNK